MVSINFIKTMSWFMTQGLLNGGCRADFQENDIR